MINELNSMMYQILTTCERKERDNAIQLIVKTLETTAKKTSENSEVCSRLTGKGGSSPHLYTKLSTKGVRSN